MPFAVAIDIGGTFTDLVAYDHQGGEVIYAKAPTSYGNFVDGCLECFRKGQIDPKDATYLNHGTTLVINSLIQRQGARTALVTTKGFRDVLEIARANRPDPFDLHYLRDEPLIPRELRFEVTERIDTNGAIISPLADSELEMLANNLKGIEVEAIAIFFMNSYRNPIHEERAAQIIRRVLPNAFVTRSTELTQEWYEYERTSTVAANAYVGPLVDSYVRRLEADIREDGFKGSLYMMGSNGGLMSVERTCAQPVGLVESGPIGGCIGAGAYAEALGLDNLIAFDMGGTTAKCALIENGRFSVESVYYVNGYVKGFPIKWPVIDITEVGSGGGSIAALDDFKRLRVGPHSAGSTPGPACYARGGTQPTVTDANLVLGRLNPNCFLGGELALDTNAAAAAISSDIAEPLGFPGRDGLLRMADGIIELATVVMAGAIRQVSVEHGLDPRDFALFAYGGGGPLHASALARELSIPLVIVPPEPGNFSAIGMLLADARIDASKTFTGLLDDDLLSDMEDKFSALEVEVGKLLEKDFGASEVYYERRAEMRYLGQRHNIHVPITGLGTAEEIRSAFQHNYKRRYGYADSTAQSELQALHLSAFARREKPEILKLNRGEGEARPPEWRNVCFDIASGMRETAIYRRDSLPPGFTGDGPAVVEEYGSTTIVWPGDRFEVGRLGELRIFTGGG